MYMYAVAAAAYKWHYTRKDDVTCVYNDDVTNVHL
jgi:hypothetical protein